MKTMVVIFTMMFTTSAFAAKENKACDTYIQAAWGDAKPQVRLELGLKALVSEEVDQIKEQISQLEQLY